MTNHLDPIRIVIAGEHSILRDGLRRLLEAEPGFVIVAETGHGSAVRRLAEAFDARRPRHSPLHRRGLGCNRCTASFDPLMEARLSDPAGRSMVIVRAVDVASVPALASVIAATGGVPGRVLPILEAPTSVNRKVIFPPPAGLGIQLGESLNHQPVKTSLASGSATQWTLGSASVQHPAV